MSGFYWATAALFVIFAQNTLTRPREVTTKVTPFTRGLVAALLLGTAILLAYAAVKL